MYECIFCCTCFFCGTQSVKIFHHCHLRRGEGWGWSGAEKNENPLFFLRDNYTAEPVLSGHPLLSGQLSKPRKLCPLIIVILTSIKRSRSPFTKSQGGSSNRSIDQSVDQPLDQSLIQSINQSINQLINHSIDQSITLQ